MTKIPIKKQKTRGLTKELKSQLKNRVGSAKALPRRNNRWSFVICLLVFLFISISLAYSFWLKKDSPFFSLMPKSAIVFSVIDQKALYEEISPLYQLMEGPYNQAYQAIFKIKLYLEKAGFDFKRDFSSLFEEKAGLVILPSNHKVFLPFVLILKKKTSESFSQRAELTLSDDYGLEIVNYRQTKISKFSLLRDGRQKGPNTYFLAEVGHYLLIASSQNAIQVVIDKAIK